MEFSLKPRTRTYRPRVDKSGFENRALEKLVQRNQYLKQMQEERAMVMRYVNGRILDLSQIDEVVPVSTRQTLLRWIAAANLTGAGKGRTEYGQDYRLQKKEGTCTLHCEDGDLVMPAYVFEFMEEKNGRSADADGAILD